MKTKHLFKDGVAGFAPLRTLAAVLFAGVSLLGGRARTAGAMLRSYAIGQLRLYGKRERYRSWVCVRSRPLHLRWIRQPYPGRHSYHQRHDQQEEKPAGAYTVQADCTGSLTLETGNTVDFVIVSRGNEVLIIDTDPDTNLTGDLKLQ